MRHSALRLYSAEFGVTASQASRRAASDGRADDEAVRGPAWAGSLETSRSHRAPTSDSAKAEVLQVQAASYGVTATYRATATEFAKVDAAYLLAKYPPGERIIVIKLGDVRVGYGPAPTS